MERVRGFGVGLGERLRAVRIERGSFLSRALGTIAVLIGFSVASRGLDRLR